jgi:hypothetical protein
MTDQALDILKLVLLALLYLFFARVLWAVWSEVRQPVTRQAVEMAPTSATPARQQRAPKGRKSTPARLVIIEPKERRDTTFAIADGLGIGREDDNTIVILGDAYVSGHHATLRVADGDVVLVDLGSKNGTILNGARLTHERHVHRGDRIQIGYTVLEAQ